MPQQLGTCLQPRLRAYFPSATRMDSHLRQCHQLAVSLVVGALVLAVSFVVELALLLAVSLASCTVLVVLMFWTEL